MFSGYCLPFDNTGNFPICLNLKPLILGHKTRIINWIINQKRKRQDFIHLSFYLINTMLIWYFYDYFWLSIITEYFVSPMICLVQIEFIQATLCLTSGWVKGQRKKTIHSLIGTIKP